MTDAYRHENDTRAAWRPVSFAADCLGYDEASGELGDTCSICGLDYTDECQCPGPTQDGYEYTERDGKLYGRRLADSIEPQGSSHDC